MLSLFAQSELSDLIEEVEKGERLGFEAGVRMMNSRDILALGYMANLVRERKNGNQTYFIVNRHIKHNRDLHDFTLSLEEIATTSRDRQETIAQIHIGGDVNAERPFDYYIEILQRVKNIFPRACIQAFTTVDVDHFTQITGLSVTEILQRLIEAGINSLPGDGTNVFSPRSLDIHEAAHRLGIHTNAKMLYGQLESTEERINHLLQLRALQDRTGWFQTFSPRSFCPENTELEGIMGVENTTGFEDLKMLAISRILLDNFDHIKTFWIMLGPKLAQVSLAFGVDDLETSQAISRRALIQMINKAGRDAVERDTLYRVHKTDGRDQRPEVRKGIPDLTHPASDI